MKKRAHGIAISGPWSWRTQGEGREHEGPGDWRPQRFYILREPKYGRKVTPLKGKKSIFQDLRWRKFQWPRQGGHFLELQKDRFVLSWRGWQVPVVSSAADKGRHVALNMSSFRGTKTLKIPKSIEFQQTNAGIWGLNCKVLQEATRECWDILHFWSFLSFFAKVIRLIRKTRCLRRYSLSSFGSPLQASTAPPSSATPRFEGSDLRLKLWHCHLPSCLSLGFTERITFFVGGGTYWLHDVGIMLT